MVSALQLILGGLAILLFYPYAVQLLYVLRARHRGLSTPRIIWSFPLGIPQFVQIMLAVRRHRMNERTVTIALDDPTRFTARGQIMGSFFTMTGDPENLKALLSTQFKDYGHLYRHTMFLPLFGDGVFTLDGPGWQHTRTLLRPQFTREQISHVHIIERNLQAIIKAFKDHYNEAGPHGGEKYLDIQPFFFKLTIDTATEFMFGESTQLLTGGNPKIANAVEFGDAFNAAQEVLMKRTVAQNFYWMIDSKEFRQACEVCKDFTSSYVDLALKRTAKYVSSSEKEKAKNEPQSYVFLDELAKETRDPIILRDQAINTLVAGRDTTASLLSWVFLMLARNKDVFFELRKTILESFGDGHDLSNVTFETLKRCDYLKYVINETLRLYPTVPNNFRYALKDTSLPRGGGPDETEPIFVPKGHLILYCTYVLHRHPLLWGSDSKEFRPMRWATRSNAHPWSYLPFNGGPRICLGQQFALTEASYTIVRLLQSFKDIEIVPQALVGDPKEISTLTLSVAEGVPIRLTPA